jgi:hypothetical protein
MSLILNLGRAPLLKSSPHIGTAPAKAAGIQPLLHTLLAQAALAACRSVYVR